MTKSAPREKSLWLFCRELEVEINKGTSESQLQEKFIKGKRLLVKIGSDQKWLPLEKVVKAAGNLQFFCQEILNCRFIANSDEGWEITFSFSVFNKKGD